MKFSLQILSLSILLLTAAAPAQNNGQEKDTTKNSAVTFYNISGENLFLPGHNSFRINEHTRMQNFNLPGIYGASTIWMRTRMAMMNSGFGVGDNEVNVSEMLHPYLNYYIESKNMSLLRQVLGMAQLGAVGYLAYRHIKKYGLFHNP